MRTTGRLHESTTAGETVAAFVPAPLPPRAPALAIVGERATLLGRAERNLSRLDVAGAMVPSLDWFVYAFVRKEAVITSQIEGTQATLVDLLASGTTVVAARLLEQLPVHPVIKIPGIVKLVKTAKPTAGKAVQLLEKLGVLVETSGKRRDRTFAYRKYLDRLRAGTELDT